MFDSIEVLGPMGHLQQSESKKKGKIFGNNYCSPEFLYFVSFIAAYSKKLSPL